MRDRRANKIDGFGVVNHMGNLIGRQTVFVCHRDNKISDSDCSACSALYFPLFVFERDCVIGNLSSSLRRKGYIFD